MRVLITGMSGTGKSSVVAQLKRAGHSAHDLDEGFTHLDPADGRWHWDLPRVRALLGASEQVVFIAGCSEEQALLPWDLQILLTAPAEVLLSRIDGQPGDRFGKSPGERAQVLSDLAEVEPLLRRSADVVLDTTQPLTDVVQAVLGAVDLSG